MAEENSYIGKKIGNYKITRRIASGGFGTVYEARHITLAKRISAIKLLHTYLGSESDREKFIQEAQLLSELEHPHILPVLDVGFQDDQPYIIMKYAEGGSLKDRLRQHPGQPLPLEEAVTILTQIGQALHYAHQHTIVHCDLKPENILFNARGEALLADFGIAVMLPLARTGQIGQDGTPAYMAPEQFEGKASVKSDQYVLGCIAYELVTGQKPFEVEGVPLEAIWYQHTKVVPTPPCEFNPDIPERLEQAILKAMEKRREARYTDVATFCFSLQSALHSPQEQEQSIPIPEETNKDAPMMGDEHAASPHNSVSSSLAEAVMNTPPAKDADQPLPSDNVDDEAWEDDLSPTPPRVPVVKSSFNGDVPVQNDAMPPSTPASQPFWASEEDDSAQVIIFPLPARGKNSGTLPAPLPPDVDELDDDVNVAAATPPAVITRRSSGKIPAMTDGASAAPAPSTTGRRRTTVVLPPVVPPPASPTARPPRRRRSVWQLLLLLLLVVLLFSCVFCGVLAVAAPGVVPVPIKNYVSSVFGGETPGAIVNITPKSANELDTYVITGVTTGTADSTKRQVEARQLTYTTPATQKTVPATGRVDIPATQTTGTLTFYNGNTIDYGVTARTVFTDASGVQVENDSAVDIPAGSPSNGYGRITVPATAVTSGSAGNIPALDFNQIQCCGSPSVLVSNGAFSGGQVGLHYSAVQQSDIDGAANPLMPQLQQSALTSLNAQRHANEQFVNKPSCSSKVTSDHLPGDKVSSVTVTVTATCNGYVYDQTAEQTLATALLKNKAKQDLQDPNYAQIGNVTTNVTSASINKGTITLFVKAEGLWVYQLSDAVKKQLARQIAGKKKKDARTFLQRQPEIGAVGNIDIPGNDDTVMPTDYTQISIVVQNPPGIAGTGTGGSPSGTSATGGSSPGPSGSSTAKP